MKIDEYIKAETTNIDYKAKLETKKPISWLKSVSTFANTKGGILLFGIEDKSHEKIGVENPQSDCDMISELINTRIKPIPRYDIDVLNDEGKNYIKLQVGDGPLTPYFYTSDGKQVAYTRLGNQSVKAEEYVLKNLILKGQNTTFDAQPSKYKKDDLSFTLLSATLKEETGKELDSDRDYVSLGLINNNGEITNAGVLLSNQGPLNQSKIVCTRWNGLTKGSIDKDAIDDKEYTGSLISLLENADTFIKNNSKSGWKIEGMSRIEFEDYPLEARREAIVNAIIHRDYQMLGAEVHIDMFDDRLEIVSPGGMCDGSFIQNWNINKVPSLRRNTIISDIFSRLHFMDRRGSGIGRILKNYNNSTIKPTFISDESSFTVMFPNKGYKAETRIRNTSNGENLVSDEDYFVLMLHKRADEKTTKKTIEQIKVLFNRFKYDEEFDRNGVKEILQVQNTRASIIINLLVDNNLAEKTIGSKYKFIK